MTCRAPRNVILAKPERAPFAVQYKSLLIEPGYRRVLSLELRSDVSLRVFIEREEDGS
jgi:hypothetical protein